METESKLDQRWTFESHSTEETRRFGLALGKLLQPGTVVALVGDLGAGKTTLVRSIAEGLGVDKRRVNSPTFILIQHYEGRIPVYHFDTYRVESVEEFLDLGAEEYFDSDGICLVEWADRVEEALPEKLLRITLSISGPESRTIRVEGMGVLTGDVVKALRRQLDV